MALNKYEFKLVSGKMHGILVWGREEEVEATKIDIQHNTDQPHALVSYCGQRMEGKRERTFFKNFHIPFSPERGLNLYFFSQPVYRPGFFGMSIHHIDHVTITLASKDSVPDLIKIKVAREKFKWGIASKEYGKNIITDIVGHGLEGLKLVQGGGE